MFKMSRKQCLLQIYDFPTLAGNCKFLFLCKGDVLRIWIFAYKETQGQ